jgi:hypothetical protein
LFVKFSVLGRSIIFSLHFFLKKKGKKKMFQKITSLFGSTKQQSLMEDPREPDMPRTPTNEWKARGESKNF